MDFIIIFGPQAVGKMTVGEALGRKLGLKLFHNHVTIDLVLKYLSWDEGSELINLFREEILKKMAISNQKGVIFTYVWAFNDKNDWNYIEYISQLFKDHNVYYIELNSDLETRLHRNNTENRLMKKWTKQDVKASNQRLKDTLIKYRTTSHPDEIHYENYLRINNTHLSVDDTVDKIITHFNLE